MESYLMISAFLICLLYLIFESARKKRHPLLTLAAIAFFVVVTAFLASLHGEVRACYYGQRESARERAFFFGIFIDELTKTGDLQKAAKYMQTPEVKERTLVRIRQIVDPFRPKEILFSAAGVLVLLLAAASLWIKGLGGKVYFPYLLSLFVLIGGILFCIGRHYRRYGFRTDAILKNHLRCQQEILMKEVAGMKTDLSIPEIVAIARKEGDCGYGYGPLLEMELRKRSAGKE